MSKVIHLSDDAHNQAKAFCKTHGLKMSDWVAGLIDAAIGGESLSGTSSKVLAMVPKKKMVEPPAAGVAMGDELPVYAAPPFWAAKANNP
ncbi:MAG: hypothetical protein EOO40_03925 [Deltaproteobacteria bacterium]|nr:MAG: hypothetical protein EOO40_03925 [Deltaproteobacteria bacterium]